MNARRHQLCFFAAALFAAASACAGNITPLQIEQTMDAQFPASLSFSTITSGEARVVINVDFEGKLADLMVTSYTHKAFADEALMLLKHWRYSPATLDGEPIGVRVEISMNFQSTGRVVSLSAMDTVDALTSHMRPAVLVSRISTHEELDRPVAPVQTISPFHPGAAKLTPQTKGSTVVDFYVDENGRTRMPVVVDTTDNAYANASVEALRQWRFSAPTRKGEPVAVRMQQKFVFPESS